MRKNLIGRDNLQFHMLLYLITKVYAWRLVKETKGSPRTATAERHFFFYSQSSFSPILLILACESFIPGY